MSNAPFSTSPIQHCHNRQADPHADWPQELNEIMPPAAIARANSEIRQWPAYQPTPLHQLDGLAAKLGMAAIYYKDESRRLGLGSFKALGGAYAVLCLLQREIATRLGRAVSLAEIRSGALAREASQITVATATDGNHGRSVAWGAQQFGCRCEIGIHAEVSAGRAGAMAALGARITRINGNYDESVRQIARQAKAKNWFIVSDTSSENYVDLPRQVAAGYTVFMAEIMAQLPAPGALQAPPTHVLVQGGVGGLASAVCAYLWQELGQQRPRFIVVEPTLADCLYQSAQNGAPTTVNITTETLMAGLSCGEVSWLGWKILAAGADDFLTIDDELVAPSMQMLADGLEGAPPIVAGESAVAGLAALIAAARRPTLAASLGLNQQSRVLLIGTEGATDPDIYQRLVGRAAGQILT